MHLPGEQNITLSIPYVSVYFFGTDGADARLGFRAVSIGRMWDQRHCIHMKSVGTHSGSSQKAMPATPALQIYCFQSTSNRSVDAHQPPSGIAPEATYRAAQSLAATGAGRGRIGVPTVQPPEANTATATCRGAPPRPPRGLRPHFAALHHLLEPRLPHSTTERFYCAHIT